MHLPEYNDIEQAAIRIKGHAIRTPLLRNDVLDQKTGARIFIKPENLQRTGSFKFRGAYNAIAVMTEAERNIGIIASSSGNHAQGVAAAARMFGAKATILMPADAPKTKMERTRALGAEVVEFDRNSQDREVVLAELVEKTGYVLVHPFNDEKVIAGQGTIGLEIVEDLAELGLRPARALMCTGGGGLTSGVALAFSHHYPQIKLYSVEPEGFDDYKRSLEAGSLVRNEKTAGSVCDAIINPTPGEIGFEINRKLLSEGLVVSDEEALAAVRFAFEELKLVVEPGGAVALAAVLKHAQQWQGEVIVLTISGGNIDPEMLQAALAAA